jgi:MOSC domain-containing protein YiiM
MDQLNDSKSQGDAGRFQRLDVLERELAALTPPRDRGSVRVLVTRRSGGVRTLLDRVSMTPASGMPGDAWGRGRRPSKDAQLTVMQIDVAELIANGQPLTLFGDNMFVDLDLSSSNLPTGSRLRAGTVTFEVTALPHNGCRKFRARFGDEALRFTSKRELRPLNLRGVYMRVVEAGEVAVGDAIHVISRPLEALAG